MSRQRKVIEAMGMVGVAILLYAIVSCPHVCQAAEWVWSESEGATGYRFYWSINHSNWHDCDRVEYPATICTGGTCYPGEFDEGWNEVPLVFYVVTAFNAAGESTTEHGPVEACP